MALGASQAVIREGGKQDRATAPVLLGRVLRPRGLSFENNGHETQRTAGDFQRVPWQGTAEMEARSGLCCPGDISAY